MRIYCILFFLLIPGFITAQSLMDLFENDLCYEIKNNSEINQLVKANLNAVEAIHPELLYYYIVAYNEQFGNSPVPTDNFDNSDLAFIKNDYIRKINDWFALQLNYLENSKTDTQLYNFEKKYFEDNKPVAPVELKVSSNKVIEIDKNMMDYFVTKYYLQDSKLIYNLNENYTVIRNDYEMEQKIKSKINFKQLSNDEISSEQAERYFYPALKLWYLFNNDDDSLSLSEFVKLIVIKKFEDGNDSGNRLTINFGLATGSTNPFVYSLDIPGMMFPISNENYELNYYQVALDAGYSFVLRKVKSFLYKFDLNLAYSFQMLDEYLKLPDLNQTPPQNSTSDELPYHRVTFSSNKIELKSFQTFSIYFKVPILYLTRNLSLSFGSRVDYNIFYYTAEFSYTYKYFKAFYRNSFYRSSKLITSSQANVPEEGGTQSYFVFYPFVNFEFNPVANFYLDLNLYPKRYNIQIGYSILS